MAKRLFDVACSIVALVTLLPILLISMIGISVCSKGPIFYKANRVGRNGEIFQMHKFRTMHVEQGNRTVITSANDNRIFRFGLLLRKLKIDELPQLYDVLRGKMSLIGPRPEDPAIVDKYYDEIGMETLKVLPGLASPGSIYIYTHGERLLVGDDIEKLYSEKLLPLKLYVDYVYVKNRTFVYDVRIILRTVLVIVLISMGKERFSDPIELKGAAK